MQDSSSTVPRLHYFDLSPFGGLAGRGGAVRFLLLTTGTEFVEDVADLSTWSSHKQAAMDSGQTPTGHLPVLHLDGQPLVEHLSIARLLAKRVGWYGQDEMKDYLADSLADAVSTGFRPAALKGAFGSAEDKTTYLTSPQQRAHFYQVTENLLVRNEASGAHTVGDSPSFADAVLFTVLWDDVAAHGEDEGLIKECPKLSSFYRAYMQQEAVLKWCQGSRSDLCKAT